MPASSDRIDKPEPRWQVILALLAIGGIHLALPRWFIVGPFWLLPGVIVVLLIPTIMTHRTGRQSLNHALGILINAITTIALVGSVVLLVTTLPSHKEAPREVREPVEMSGPRGCVVATGVLSRVTSSFSGAARHRGTKA